MNKLCLNQAASENPLAALGIRTRVAVAHGFKSDALTTETSPSYLGVQKKDLENANNKTELTDITDKHSRLTMQRYYAVDNDNWLTQFQKQSTKIKQNLSEPTGMKQQGEQAICATHDSRLDSWVMERIYFLR